MLLLHVRQVLRRPAGASALHLLVVRVLRGAPTAVVGGRAVWSRVRGTLHGGARVLGVVPGGRRLLGVGLVLHLVLHVQRRRPLLVAAVVGQGWAGHRAFCILGRGAGGTTTISCRQQMPCEPCCIESLLHGACLAGKHTVEWSTRNISSPARDASTLGTRVAMEPLDYVESM